ncbi:MAG: hypoxanthine-guanine phosphoribosyltransferase [Gammaproteobacteria bacterium]|nr:hypoxanthine-guanine phosphoribosyltransferase [Gammaproteobacteria bacterium]
MIDPQQARQALERAERLVDRDAVGRAYDALAARIAADYAQRDPLLLAVAVGGMVPTVELAQRLPFPLEMDYLHATRYRSGTRGGALTWKRQPAPERIAGRHVIVIDDVLDEGRTLAAVCRALAGFAPAGIAVAVMVEKQVAREADAARADYVGLRLPNRYLFGCGMDYGEHWRHLPEIWALRE